MASDFYTSTQHDCWQFPKAELQRVRDDLEAESSTLSRQWMLPQPRLVNIYLQQLIVKLAKRLSVQQPVLSTALVFVRRFYLKVPVRKTNPYLLVATAFYLACKVEEAPQHIKMVVTEAKTLWSDFITPLPGTLGECEFLLISEIGAQLVVHHPYKALKELHEMLNLTLDEYTLAWSVINDHYVTDLPFLYPPHVIAAAAVSFTLNLRPSTGPSSGGMPKGTTASAAAQQVARDKLQKLKNWLITSGIDVEGMVDCTQEVISMYVVWEQYSERDCRDQINRFVKGRGLDR